MSHARRKIGEWGDVRVKRGEKAEVAIHVSETYAGTNISIPVVVWRGERPGPTLFVTGAVHGDEINGSGAIRELINTPGFQPDCGGLLLVPVVNIMGFERHSRYLPDRRDLNRCFPGSGKGSLASRMARAVFDEIVARSDFGIDLHTAAVRRTNFPNVRADLTDARLAPFARAFGTELIVSSLGPAGSLRAAACRAGCPTLILEAGEVWKVEPAYVEYAHRGVRNCMRYLGMIKGDAEEPPYRVEAKSTRWIRARRGGFLRFHVGPGDFVSKGDLIATNTSLAGRELNTIESPCTGFVLGMTTIPSVAPGDPICHIALPDADGLERAERAHASLPDDSLYERTRDSLSSSVLVDEPGPDADPGT